MGDFDGGSAAPATPDVLRTPDRWLAEPEFDGIDVLDPDGWRGATGRLWTDPISRAEFRARLWRSTITGPVRGLGHSGVAGERSDSRIDSETGPTRVPAPDPANPSAELTTGCVAVSDEAVEAAATVLAESGLLAGSIWAGEDGAVRGVAQAVANRVAPLIAAQALRQVAEVIEVACPARPYCRGDDGCAYRRSAELVRERADELERGGDQ